MVVCVKLSFGLVKYIVLILNLSYISTIRAFAFIEKKKKNNMRVFKNMSKNDFDTFLFVQNPSSYIHRF